MDDLKSIYNGSATSEERVSFFKRIKTDAVYREKFKNYRTQQDKLKKKEREEFNKRFGDAGERKMKVLKTILFLLLILFLVLVPKKIIWGLESLENHARFTSTEITMGGDSPNKNKLEAAYELMNKEDYGEAIEAFKIIPLDKEEPEDYYEIQYRIAYAHAQLKNNDEALKILEHILLEKDLSYDLKSDSEMFKSYLLNKR